MKTNSRLLFEILGLLGVVALIAIGARFMGGSSDGTEQAASEQVKNGETAHQPIERASMGALGKEGGEQTEHSLPIPESNQNSESAFPGFTLYPTSGTAEVVLVSQDGSFAHRWEIDADRARLLPNCNLLAIHGSKWGLEREPWASLRSVVREYSWDGEVVWEKKLPDDAHHDITILENGNILILYLTRVPEEVVESQLGQKNRKVNVRSDVLLEVDRSGQEVWRWDAHEHLSLTDCGARDCPDLSDEKLRTGGRRFDWTHINTVREIPENKWYDQGDQRFRPGNIIVFPRNFWSSIIIDRQTGKEVWRYHGNYKGGISGGHESYMIPKGYPGAGNVLIFDNGRVHETSHVLEVNPVTEEIVWKYEDGKQFFSRVAGSAQRLPNGNTLISEDTTGRVFEVNRAGKMVWNHHVYKHRINRAIKYPVGFCPKLKEDVL